jgi:UDP-glucose 4-epimerase
MRRVLLTGSEGQVGRRALPALEHAGWTVRPFDLLLGDDLRDEAAVAAACAGCDAVVHGGAIAHDSAGTPAEIVATNVLGTWHVLLGAGEAGARRVVYLSSAQVFGFAEGESGGVPAYVPVDDEHPLRAARPYGMSKRLAEEECEAWSRRTGATTVVLRPVMILSDEGLEAPGAPDAFELGAFVHVDDVVGAILLGLSAAVGVHVRLTLCGAGPYDVSRAAAVLGWRPQPRGRPGWPSGRP